MEHYFGIPQKDENQESEGSIKLDYGFSIELSDTMYGGSYSKIDFFYNEIKLEYMEHIFLVKLASFLESFSTNRMQNDKAYEVAKYFTLKSIITTDDLPMLSCSILYRVTGDKEVLTEKIFLDPAEAYFLAKHIHHILATNKTYTFYQT
ncbi:MAG TPA: hypothetical protein EYH42_02615 [Sulfurovum sp.]|nr:hypothetical protein [Sulfurovum sp.]